MQSAYRKPIWPRDAAGEKLLHFGSVRKCLSSLPGLKQSAVSTVFKVCFNRCDILGVRCHGDALATKVKQRHI